MKCPYCEFAGAWRPLQAHLAASHGDRVETRLNEAQGRMLYVVTCPVCGAAYEHPVKPRGDPRFVDEHAREIRLVAFDMLLGHLAGEHQALEEDGSD